MVSESIRGNRFRHVAQVARSDDRALAGMIVDDSTNHNATPLLITSHMLTVTDES